MPWKCKHCNFDANDDGSRQCQGCLRYLMPRAAILLDETSGRQRAISITTTLGRRTLSQITDDAHYASEAQFEVIRDEGSGKWLIRTLPSATNPTFYKGEPLGEEPHALEETGFISIGPERMKLQVKLEY